MQNANKIAEISNKERETFISRMASELPALRAKLGISQEDLASMVGISRQTYSSIETKRRKMTWNTFMSFVLIFDCNAQTHDSLRRSGLFPYKIVKNEEASERRNPILSFIQMNEDDVQNHFDEQAIHAIETVIMVEYARCNNMTSDAVIKAFDGKRATQVSKTDVDVRNALTAISKKSNS